MAQIRFNVGVPRAGSAAQDAESAKEHFRSLRPQAGSAARQAEEESRRAQAEGTARSAGVTTLRMRGVSHADGSVRASSAWSTDTSAQQNAAPPAAPVPPQMVADQLSAGPVPSADVAQPVLETAASDGFHPLQTAAATFKSLFRSVFSRATGEN